MTEPTKELGRTILLKALEILNRAQEAQITKVEAEPTWIASKERYVVSLLFPNGEDVQVQMYLNRGVKS